LHIDEYVLRALLVSEFHVSETNLMGAILMGLHIYLTILSDLCLEFMQIGDTPPDVDDVPYLGQVFNAVQV
jgi:hypothetical protein